MVCLGHQQVLIRRASAFQPGMRVLVRELAVLAFEYFALVGKVEQQAFPRKEQEEVLKEQVPLPILHRKKEVLVVLPQQVLERVPQELGEE